MIIDTTRFFRARASNLEPLPTTYDFIESIHAAVRTLGRRLGQLYRRDGAAAALRFRLADPWRRLDAQSAPPSCASTLAGDRRPPCG